jgi:hypothetical protein
VKLLLALLLFVFVLSVRAGRRGRAVRTWPLVLATFVVALAFLDFGMI